MGGNVGQEVPTHGNSRSGVERTTRSRRRSCKGHGSGRRPSGMGEAVRGSEVMSLTRDRVEVARLSYGERGTIPI